MPHRDPQRRGRLSSPDMSGRRMSQTTASGRLPSISASASRPVVHQLTTVPSSASRWTSDSPMIGSSSSRPTTRCSSDIGKLLPPRPAAELSFEVVRRRAASARRPARRRVPPPSDAPPRGRDRSRQRSAPAIRAPPGRRPYGSGSPGPESSIDDLQAPGLGSGRKGDLPALRRGATGIEEKVEHHLPHRKGGYRQLARKVVLPGEIDPLATHLGTDEEAQVFDVSRLQVALFAVRAVDRQRRANDIANATQTAVEQVDRGAADLRPCCHGPSACPAR